MWFKLEDIEYHNSVSGFSDKLAQIDKEPPRKLSILITLAS